MAEAAAEALREHLRLGRERVERQTAEVRPRIAVTLRTLGWAMPRGSVVRLCAMLDAPDGLGDADRATFDTIAASARAAVARVPPKRSLSPPTASRPAPTRRSGRPSMRGAGT